MSTFACAYGGWGEGGCGLAEAAKLLLVSQLLSLVGAVTGEQLAFDVVVRQLGQPSPTGRKSRQGSARWARQLGQLGQLMWAWVRIQVEGVGVVDAQPMPRWLVQALCKLLQKLLRLSWAAAQKTYSSIRWSTPQLAGKR